MHTKRDKEKLLNRVRRLRGQLDGIERGLLDDAHDCYAILQTIAACRGAINGLMAEVLEGHIREHIIDESRKPSKAEADALEGLIDVVRSYLK
jgi:DNA-binding FrmR family transcriptional regulator